MSRVRNIMAACALIAATTVAWGSEEPVGTRPQPTPSASITVAPAPPSAVAVQPAPNRDDVNVDARDFEQAGGQYFFTSPSGNVFCGFTSRNAPGTVVGCQVRNSVPGNTGRQCLNTANNTYGVQIRNDGTVEQICTNQGIFVGDANSPGVRVLDYGQVIGITGTFCRSAEAGITCYDGNKGFMISRDVNVAF